MKVEPHERAAAISLGRIPGLDPCPANHVSLQGRSQGPGQGTRVLPRTLILHGYAPFSVHISSGDSHAVKPPSAGRGSPFLRRPPCLLFETSFVQVHASAWHERKFQRPFYIPVRTREEDLVGRLVLIPTVSVSRPWSSPPHEAPRAAGPVPGLCAHARGKGAGMAARGPLQRRACEECCAARRFRRRSPAIRDRGFC